MNGRLLTTIVASLFGLLAFPTSATTYFRQQPPGTINNNATPTQILFASVSAGKWVVLFNAKSTFTSASSTEQSHLADCGIYINDVDYPAFHGTSGFFLMSPFNLTADKTDMIPINAVITLTQTSNVAVKCTDAPNPPLSTISGATLTIMPIAALK